MNNIFDMTASEKVCLKFVTLNTFQTSLMSFDHSSGNHSGRYFSEAHQK